MPTVLITGANRGLGLEFARQYLVDGWQVIATCRNPNAATALHALAVQDNALCIEQFDVTDKHSIAALTIVLGTDQLDLLINNAGVLSADRHRSARLPDQSQFFGTLDEMSWSHILAVNCIAPVMVSQALMPNLRRSENPKIAMVSSRMGSITLQNTPGDIAYRTSKAALNAAARNMALTLTPENIPVAILYPGWVKTDMGGDEAPLLPQESVTGMRKVIANLTMAQSGSFLNFDGSNIAW
jgi:NAD(P)-dependent dehydrogenase (short-subunit alcohol dehydrogenase family)